MSKKPVSIHITHDGDHQLEIQCSGNPFGILYCLAKTAAKTIRLSDCLDDKTAAVTAFTLQTLEFLAEDEDGTK